MTSLGVEPAYAKVNLCLFLGPTREDGRHELVTVFESVDLADQLTLTALTDGVADEVVCSEVEGPNLVSAALDALRAAGWDAPPLRVAIDKRIPVAAGMGGGSADAAAILRRAGAIAPVPAATVERIAAQLGADVPSQLRPGPSIGTGAGELLAPLQELPEHSLLVLPQAFGLSTPAVFAEADRLGLPRDPGELTALHAAIDRELRAGRPLPDALAVNDLQPAALSLRPEIGEALGRGLEAGADRMLVCGSGPTTIGIFWGQRGEQRARDAARSLRARYPSATVAQPVVSAAEAPVILDS